MEPKSILIGAGIIAVGALLIVAGFRKNKRCSCKVIGRITGIHEDIETDDDGFNHYSYSPEYEYEVDGKIYRDFGGTSYNKQKKIHIGGDIVIYYNPEKPGDHLPKGSGKALPVLGLAVMALGAILIACAFA